MSAVLDLCDRWDALSKGETATTRAIREAHAQDMAVVEHGDWHMHPDGYVHNDWDSTCLQIGVRPVRVELD